MPRRKKGDPSIRTLKNKLDILWSKYIKLSEANSQGYAACASCGQMQHISEMDCGHFISRNHNAGRYKRENCHVQCRKCNRFREGNKAGYAVFLMNKYGPGIVDELNQLQYKVYRFTIPELRELIHFCITEMKALNHE